MTLTQQRNGQCGKMNARVNLVAMYYDQHYVHTDKGLIQVV